jgi:hypothetical protein
VQLGGRRHRFHIEQETSAAQRKAGETGWENRVMRAPVALVGLAVMAVLAGCGSSSSVADGVGSPSAEPRNRFELARGCYALQSVSSGRFARGAGQGYVADAEQPADAEAFYMQAATLGQYLFFASNQRMLNAGGSSVGTLSEPADSAIWVITEGDRERQFTVYSETADRALVAAADGALTLGGINDAAAQFRFVPTSVSCTPYPEMPIAIVGETFKGRGVDQPIIGFADVHTHMGMSSEMSVAGNVGPSAGGVLYGEVVHRFGVPHALEDCASFHGPNGIRDANNILEGTPVATHQTQGWPTFVDWPRRNFLTHQVMYYRWVERAWMSGLRLMVNHGTNIAALCRVGQLYALRPDADCDDMGVAVKQIQYLRDVQDYIDAQHGGPGKGWFRIVLSPQEAREVINDGKLAVVLGIEVAQVLGCGVTMLPGGIEIRRCDEAQVDSEIQRLWDLGVRHIYPYHDIDSSLGGAGIFSGDVINLLNFLDTGQFWRTTECRDYPEDEPSVRLPGAEMTLISLPGIGNDPLTDAVLNLTGGTLPVYPQGRRCNERTVTDLGDYTLRAMMNRRMVIDIDHAAYHSKDIMLDIAEQQDPPYPMASSHDAHGGLTSDQAIRMLQHGGTIYPYKGNGNKHRDFLQDLKFWRERAGVQDTVLGLGYGADGNGFGGHPGPRGGNAEPVRYPFTLFSGPEWGPQFSHAKPVTVELLTIPESGKFWHIDEVGMAHYGLVADFVEEVRLESGREGLDALYNSAEAYVQMWERVYNRGSDAP